MGGPEPLKTLASKLTACCNEAVVLNKGKESLGLNTNLGPLKIETDSMEGNMGEKLLDAITKATGLPDEMIRPEIQRLVSESNFEAEDITLDQLREVLADYLQDVILEAKDNFS